MRSLLKPLSHYDPEAVSRPVPGLRTTAIALVGSMLSIGAAESLIGGLDQADDVTALAAGTGRLTAGGMLLLLAAILLGVFVAGIGRVVWASLPGRIGWVLLTIAVPCGGAFAMFHLALVETAASGLDAAAMDEFIVERFHGPGPWGAPVAFFAIVGLMSILLVLVALVRVNLCSLAAPLVFGGGMLGEALLGDGGSEIGSHWLMAAATVVAAHGLWRTADPTNSLDHKGTVALLTRTSA